MKPPVHSIQPAQPGYLKVQRLQEPRFTALYNIQKEQLEEMAFTEHSPADSTPLQKKALAAVKRYLLGQ